MNQKEWLKTWRENNALEDSEAASLLNVPLKTYRNWEKGRSMTAAALSLVVAVSELIEAKGEHIINYKKMARRIQEEFGK